MGAEAAQGLSDLTPSMQRRLRGTVAAAKPAAAPGGLDAGDGGQRRGRCCRPGAEREREARAGRDVRGCIPQCLELPAAFSLPAAAARRWGKKIAQILFSQPPPPHLGSAPQGPGERSKTRARRSLQAPLRAAAVARTPAGVAAMLGAGRMENGGDGGAAAPGLGLKVAPAGAPGQRPQHPGVQTWCPWGRRGKKEALGSEPGLGATGWSCGRRFVLWHRLEWGKRLPSQSFGFPCVRPLRSKVRPGQRSFVLDLPPQDAGNAECQLHPTWGGVDGFDEKSP